MLLLSRKKGERITIGDNTTIVVTRITNNRVVIGVEAPADVRIAREEINPGPANSKKNAAANKLSVAQETCLSRSTSTVRGNIYLARRAQEAAIRRRALIEAGAPAECASV